MKKTVESLEEFLTLDYEMKITPFREEDEYGFIITCPELPGLEVYGDTITEALEEVREAKIALFQMSEDTGTVVNYPNNSIEKKPSGRLTARLPITLHNKLKSYAEQNKVSVNSALVLLLNEGFRVMDINKIVEEVHSIKKFINRDINIIYQKKNRNIQIPFSMEKQPGYEQFPKNIKTKYSYDNTFE